MSTLLPSFLLAFGVIFVAELGDKSQLLAMALAARYRFWPVLIGLSIATAVMHLASVAIGAAVGRNLPTQPVLIVAGLAFLGFAWWTWRGDELDDSDEAKVEEASAKKRSPVVTASILFAVAELGDKTMLATIALAANGDVVGVWLGSTLGMIAADALAIALGAVLGAKLPERVVRIGATVLFVLFGLVLIVEGVRG